MTDSMTMEAKAEVVHDDRVFYTEVRRALITLARAICKRWGHHGLLIVLGVE